MVEFREVVTRRIETLNEALELFEAVVKGDEPEFNALEFGDYFNVNFRLPSYSSEVPRQFIQAYHANYRRIYQLIALIENGRADIKTLTKEQQDRYGFSVRVADGSSRLEDNGADLLGRACVEAFKKMSGRQAVITILGAVLLCCTTWGMTAYIAAQKEKRVAEIQSRERVDLVKTVSAAHVAEADRMGRVIEAMQQSGEAGSSAVAAVIDIQDQRLRAMSETDVTQVGDLEITGDQARELRSYSRRKSTMVTVDKQMRVVDVNTADVAETIVILEDVETGEQTKLRYIDRMVGETFSPIVIEALAARSTATFTLRGRLIDDEITYTEIVEVTPIALEDGLPSQSED